MAIEPIFLIHLLAAGGRHEHIVAECPVWSKFMPSRERAVAFDEEGRRAHRSAGSTTSRGAGDLPKLARQFAGELVVGVHLRAVDLHVDRREASRN